MGMPLFFCLEPSVYLSEYLSGILPIMVRIIIEKQTLNIKGFKPQQIAGAKFRY